MSTAHKRSTRFAHLLKRLKIIEANRLDQVQHAIEAGLESNPNLTTVDLAVAQGIITHDQVKVLEEERCIEAREFSKNETLALAQQATAASSTSSISLRDVAAAIAGAGLKKA